MVRVTDRQGDFLLEFTASSRTYVEDEPVIAVARFHYRGTGTGARLYGSSSGPIFFSIEQVDGDIDMTAGGHDDCPPHDFVRGRPLKTAFRKSGGYTFDDPDADFWEAFLADPLLRLPPGQYRLSALVGLHAGEGCDGPLMELRTTLEIEVVAR